MLHRVVGLAGFGVQKISQDKIGDTQLTIRVRQSPLRVFEANLSYSGYRSWFVFQRGRRGGRRCGLLVTAQHDIQLLRLGAELFFAFEYARFQPFHFRQ